RPVGWPPTEPQGPTGGGCGNRRGAGVGGARVRRLAGPAHVLSSISLRLGAGVSRHSRAGAVGDRCVRGAGCTRRPRGGGAGAGAVGPHRPPARRVARRTTALATATIPGSSRVQMAGDGETACRARAADPRSASRLLLP